MKKLFTLALVLSSTFSFVLAQDKTTVTATNSEISDNLDLRAIATIFGEASDLEDFEKKINDPKAQISNLDLNEDNYVDYLRVIESVENNVHLIIVQSVLDKDKFQDVATIEVQKDENNKVQVQVVGDVYMYGQNYIYEPIYVHTPIIYSTFWVTNYRPYCSSWYWNFYPSYYYYWNPFPIFRYRNHINIYIGGYGHVYNYVNYRRCHVAYNNYYGRRGNAYETRYPDRSFTHRNATVSNRYELDRTRETRIVNPRERGNTTPRIETPRSETTSRTETSRNDNTTRKSETIRTEAPTRNENTVRTEAPTRKSETIRTETPTRNENTVRTEAPTRKNETIRTEIPTRNENTVRTEAPTRKNETIRTEAPRVSSPRVESPSRNSSPSVSGPSRNSSPTVSAPSRSSAPSGNSSRGGSSRGGRG